jgi:hypothetical protein
MQNGRKRELTDDQRARGLASLAMALYIMECVEKLEAKSRDFRATARRDRNRVAPSKQ